RYARTGRFPRLAISSLTASDKAERLPENEHTFQHPADPARQFHLSDGTVFLEPGQMVTIFTGGLHDCWHTDKQRSRDGIAGYLAQQKPDSEPRLRDALSGLIGESLRRARARGVRDDLTAVAIRLEPK
ncbi:MAG: hypothetical protein ACKV2V_12870, partial [Blastocatellia bacterium]